MFCSVSCDFVTLCFVLMRPLAAGWPVYLELSSLELLFSSLPTSLLAKFVLEWPIEPSNWVLILFEFVKSESTSNAWGGTIGPVLRLIALTGPTIFLALMNLFTISELMDIPSNYSLSSILAGVNSDILLSSDSESMSKSLRASIVKLLEPVAPNLYTLYSC